MLTRSVRWLRYAHGGSEGFGMLADDDTVAVCTGDMFSAATPTGERLPLSALRPLIPCRPGKLIGLWNNSHQRALKENLQRPVHPLYFLKAANCYAASGDTIRRPAGYAGPMVFEAELGIVIGRRCSAATIAEAAGCIFGYTCVNDVTARELLRLDPAFQHWTRAKSFDSFGVFGPVIATAPDLATLRIRALLDGVELQNYPVDDLVFKPDEIVSRLSHDMTLEAGDVIACGTSVGAGLMNAGSVIEIAIDGIGCLVNPVA